MNGEKWNNTVEKSECMPKWARSQMLLNSDSVVKQHEAHLTSVPSKSAAIEISAPSKAARHRSSAPSKAVRRDKNKAVRLAGIIMEIKHGK